LKLIWLIKTTFAS